MITIRPATSVDIDAIARFNLAMALETEDKQLDAAVLHRGVTGMQQRPELGFYLVACLNDVAIGCLGVTLNGATGDLGCSGGFKVSMLIRIIGVKARFLAYSKKPSVSRWPLMRSLGSDFTPNRTTSEPFAPIIALGCTRPTIGYWKLLCRLRVQRQHESKRLRVEPWSL